MLEFCSTSSAAGFLAVLILEQYHTEDAEYISVHAKVLSIAHI